MIGGTGDIDDVRLPDDGTYTVTVDPPDRAIGTLTMRLYTSPDRITQVTVGDTPVVATIERPGQVATLRFDGTAGEKISVGATAATLPDECGVLRLLSPTGTRLDEGCVIQGRGSIDPFTLPTSGTYSLVVNPSDEATGSVTLTIHQ